MLNFYWEQENFFPWLTAQMQYNARAKDLRDLEEKLAHEQTLRKQKFSKEEKLQRLRQIRTASRIGTISEETTVKDVGPIEKPMLPAPTPVEPEFLKRTPWKTPCCPVHDIEPVSYTHLTLPTILLV